MNFLNNESVKEKKPWVETSRYGPATDGVEVAKLKDERQKKFESSKVKENRSDYVPKVYQDWKERRKEVKKKSREEYRMRVVARGPLNWTNPNYRKDLNQSQRLMMYNKHHKCPCHGMRYNSIVMRDPVQYLCDRLEYPERELAKVDSRCVHCTNNTVFEYEKHHCLCRVLVCKFCFYTSYEYDSKIDIVCRCEQRVAERLAEQVRRNVVLTKPSKTWKQVQERANFFKEMKGKVESSNKRGWEKPKREFGAHGASFSGAADIMTESGKVIVNQIKRIGQSFKLIGKKFVELALEMKVPDVRDKLSRAYLAAKDKYNSMRNFIFNTSNLLSAVNVVGDIIERAGTYLMNNIHIIPAFLVLCFDAAMTPFNGMWIAKMYSICALMQQSIEIDELRNWKKTLKTIAEAFSRSRFTDYPENGVQMREFDAHGSEGMMDCFARFFSIGVKSFNTKVFLAGVRTLNTIFTFKRNLLDTLSNLASHFPTFLKAFVKATDTKYLIRTRVTKEGSPFHAFCQAAMAVNIAREMRATDVDLAAEIATFQERKRVLLNHIKDENLPYDVDMISFISKVEAIATVKGPIGEEINEPFIIRVSGDPGVGKSSLTVPIFSAVDPGLTKDQIISRTFNRNPAAEHWDGCTKEHEFLVYDDFNQFREEKDLSELILIASKTLFMPPYANIDPNERVRTGIKGDAVAFKAVLLHSNTTHITPKTLNSEGAINRRKHVMYNISFVDQLKPVPKTDLSHMRISKLNDTYQPKWTCDGIEGFKMMQQDIFQTYKQFKAKNVDLTGAIDNLMFVENVEDVILEQTQLERLAMELDVRASRIRKLEQSRVFPAHSFETSFWSQEASIALQAIIAGAGTTLHFIYAGIGIHLVVNYANWLFKFLACFTFLASVVAMFAMLKAAQKEFVADSGEQRNKAHPVKLFAHEKREVVADELLPNNFASNLARIEVTSRGATRAMNGVFVEGHVCMINKHLFYSFEKGEDLIDDGDEIKIYDWRVAEPFVTYFDRKRFFPLNYNGKDRDLALYMFENRVPARKSIVKHFNDGSYSLLHRRVASYQHDYKTYTVHHGSVSYDRVEATVIFSKAGDRVKILQHEVAEITIPSSPGLCGSLVICNDNLIQRKIIGINVGATMPGHSAVLLVTERMLRDGLNKIEAVFPNHVRRDFEADGLNQGWREPTPEEVAELDMGGQITVYAKSDFRAMPSKNSKIRESPIHDLVFPHTTKPCVLSPGGLDKLKMKMQKYGKPSKRFDPKFLEEAVESIEEELSSVKTVRLHRMLTVEEAINGIEGMPYITSMDMSTSPGFPFVGMGMKGEKRQYFEGQPGHYRPNALLHNLIIGIHANIEKGILPDYPFTNTLKDERKDNEDVDNGKVRMFSMSSVAIAIVMRQYFLPMIAHLYQCRHKTFLTIGMDKTSKEWDSFVRRMLEVGSEFEDADHEGFDNKANLEIRTRLNKFFVENWMTGLQKRGARTLLEADAQALHQFLEWILIVPSGTSSGSMMTAIIGSLINETYIRTSFLTIMQNTAFNQMTYYYKYVRTKNYGDDFVMTVHDELKPYFNCSTIASFLKQFDIIMTSGDKKSDFQYRSVNEFTFLRHKTGKLAGFYVPLAKDPLEQINWYRVGVHAEPAEVACENNCNSALRACFFYGSEYFNDARERIRRVRPEYKLLRFTPLLDNFLEFGRLCDVEGTFGFGEARMSPARMLEFSAHGKCQCGRCKECREKRIEEEAREDALEQDKRRVEIYKECKKYFIPKDPYIRPSIDVIEEDTLRIDWYCGHFEDMLDVNHHCEFCPVKGFNKHLKWLKKWIADGNSVDLYNP